MEVFQQRFLDLAIRRKALTFGEFTLKSGRLSPYFFNAGKFCCGEDLAILAGCYADALEASQLEYDMLFGPAYKGIPLVAGTAMALATNHQKNAPYSFNRKERKDHGEGGALVGAPLQGRVVIVDDVITAGTAIREAIGIIQTARARPTAILIALDREETGPDGESALRELENAYQLTVISLVRLADVMDYISQEPQLRSFGAKISAYRAKYGVK